MRSRLALVATLVCTVFGVVSAPAVAQPLGGTTVPPKVTSIPPLYTMPIHGVAKNGKKFVGTFSITRFVAGKKRVFAVGTLKGRLKGRHVTRYGVMIPAKLTDPSGASKMAARAAASNTCQVLHLVLGPINLNLLGLRVKLGGGTAAKQPIVLDITAQQGGGLLGNLLCGLTNTLSGTGVLSQLQGQLGNLSATLNSLVSLLGQL